MGKQLCRGRCVDVMNVSEKRALDLRKEGEKLTMNALFENHYLSRLYCHSPTRPTTYLVFCTSHEVMA